MGSQENNKSHIVHLELTETWLDSHDVFSTALLETRHASISFPARRRALPAPERLWEEGREVYYVDRIVRERKLRGSDEREYFVK